ncbi:MAG: glutamine synthetase family protein [bacterium]
MQLNADKLVCSIKKPRKEFTKKDIIKFIKDNNIPMLNFNYVGGDGKLKTLSFAINNESHLNELLEYGERVDGSSLFSYIDSANSDVYVVPRFKTAFLNPFAPLPTLNILCSYFDSNGKELDIAPEYIVKKAHEQLKKHTGISLNTLGELEYYVIFDKKENDWFPGIPQKNYHESSPFVKFENLRDEILYTISSIGAKVKYAHSEVGNITLNGRSFEQYEIEFLPEPLEDMADHIVIAKWIMRNISAKYGVGITFAPKLAFNHAGTGLHIHIEADKNNKNITLDNNGKLSVTAKKIIGGLLELAPSLTAFGNTNPISYMRLVPHQEAPTYICWGEKNRSALIRIPLGWALKNSMSKQVNKQDTTKPTDCPEKQTFELRSPDGSANIHLLLAGIAVAARHGLMNDASLQLTQDLYVDKNIFRSEKRNELKHLPVSCKESAKKLKEQESIYLEHNVFSQKIIDGLIKRLESFDTKDLGTTPEDIQKYIEKFINCG